MSIKFENITVVVQGPVSASRERTQKHNATELCLKSIRDILPGSQIILSTWAGQNTENLDYDELILSPDPGNYKYENLFHGIPRYLNVNRQIKSTLAGLKQVKTKYAIKLRSDNILLHSNFINLFEQFQQRNEQLKLLNNRVISSAWFSRNPNTFLPFPYHPSDLFFFGETEDLINIWDIDFADNNMAYYFNHHPDLSNFQSMQPYQYFPEQFIWLSFLKKNGVSVKCNHYCDVSPENINHSELSITNNLFIAHPKTIGFASPKHKIDFSNLDTITTVYTDFEYLTLYKKYCDADFKLNNIVLNKLALWIYRLWGLCLFKIKRRIKIHAPRIIRLYVKLRA